jgi:hypothetical protein
MAALAPAICSALTAVATLLAMPILLWALMPFGTICAIRGVHPFDLIYNLGLRHLLGTQRLPRYAAPRRFACLFATTWLGITGGAFLPVCRCSATRLAQRSCWGWASPRAPTFVQDVSFICA